MRLIVFFTSLLLTLTATAQTNPSDYQVTLNGIGPFKINMKKTDVEKLLGTTIATPHNSNKDSYVNDTVKIIYKDIDLSLVFYQNYIAQNKTELAIYAIQSSCPLLKTKSGIVTGDDKIKAVSTYDGYDMHISYEWNKNDKGEYKRSKNKSSIMLMGENTISVIFFKMTDNKITGFEVSVYEGD
jgi:hypothetical protein